MNIIAKVIIVGADENLLLFKEDYLLKEGFDVVSIKSFKELDFFFNAPQLLLINHSATNINIGSLDILEYIRSKDSQIPIIFISEQLSEEQIEEVFLKGADDCLLKPFGLRELFCRIKVLLKRSYGIGQEHLIHKGIFLDLNQRICSIDKVEIELTKLEFELLSFFIKHKNIILDREYILESIWKDSSMKKRTINVSINRLVKKIDPHNRHKYFTAIRGIGYRFG